MIFVFWSLILFKGNVSTLGQKSKGNQLVSQQLKVNIFNVLRDERDELGLVRVGVEGCWWWVVWYEPLNQPTRRPRSVYDADLCLYRLIEHIK